MKIIPEFANFLEVYGKNGSGKPQVVWTKLIADLDTPVSAMLKLAHEQPNSFLLESVEGGTNRGRYSFIGLRPDLIWRCFGKKAEINRNAIESPDDFTPCPIAEASNVISSLRSIVNESRIDVPYDLPPMASGLVGYLSYDMVRLIEEIPDENPDVIGVPDSVFLRPTVMAVFDSLEDSVTVITPVWPESSSSAKASYNTAKERLTEVVDKLCTEVSPDPPKLSLDHNLPEPKPNMSREEFCGMVRKAVEYINAGDAFQVVPSQRFKLPFALPPFSFYRSLRRLNPSPFLFYLNFGNFSVVGSSPEILVRVRDGKITLRPLAGTRKRGASLEQDKALAEELLADPKELAEHLMLLDLGRNDVGRIANVGTVNVTEQFTIEYYSHVMHIASNVTGEIDHSFDAIDALMAGFPAGTVSGAPKVRAMEIIEELEPERRGVYSGCIGYFGANGDMDTCIALRTAVIKDKILYIQAGGGVVADSNPEDEYQESCNKAQALIRAAQEAVKSALGKI
ncbi:MAG: anthranilate synthase component I [Pseudomonadota bacterium]|nr:anthranilate synthase component I [Pseudomonadota bacterium]